MAKVKDYMQTDFEQISDSTPLYQVLKRMSEEQIAYFIVVNAANQMAGVLTRGDIIHAKGTSTLKQGIVRDLVGDSIIIAVGSEEYMEDALRKMERFPVDQLVVVDVLRPMGVLTKDDIIRWEWDEENKGNKNK